MSNVSTFQPGDKVIFISESGFGITTVKAVKGQEYEVAECYNYGNTAEFVRTTCGVDCWASRFVLKTPATPAIVPTDFTNLELRTLQSIMLQSVALDLDVNAKRDALNAAVAAKEDFTARLGEYGVSVLAGKEEAASVLEKSLPLSGRAFSSITKDDLALIKVGDAIRYVGTKEQADDDGLVAEHGQIFTVSEVDRKDASILVEYNDFEELQWIWVGQTNSLEEFFVFA